MKEEYKKICAEAFDTWGGKSQVLMLLEEMAELQKELLKNINRDQDNIKEIAEEVADVYITLEEVKIAYDIEKEVEEVIEKKMMRLKNKLDDWKSGK